MKNSIITLLAAVAMLSCNKKETTANNTDADTMSMSSGTDTSMASSDSLNANTATTQTNLSEQDKMFVDAAAKGGMMEVMMGQLAATNAGKAEVKALGATIVKDHSAANEELKSWASTANYTLPASMDADQQKKHDELKAKKGAEFDKAYSQLMVEDHKKDIALFKKQIANGTDTSVKAFAEKTLPHLEHHLMEAEKAMAAMK